MSAQLTPQAATDLVNIEIDGKALQAPKGSMIIQAADKARIAIPRFCYHDKLSIAANCRMCLVDIEKSPKPQPACATPVMEGMKVHTQSKRALDAQRNVMEFLLINHPLDCPICDQGGECELQDLSMGYGRSLSRFVERKRVVADEDLGPLVATEMTRCIQCTRCVRVLDEIAGTQELGGMGRGEHLEIGTHIGKAIESELSGNVIDVCPVGALTNKPFRFRARAWELIARESIGYHDALGSNLFLHTRNGEVLRTVPRDNETINECWLSDRDRYSHLGLGAADRVRKPLLRAGAGWREASWDEALTAVADTLRRADAEAMGALVAPNTSCEEGYLLAKLLRGLGCANIDHRLRQLDFADQESLHAEQRFQMPLAAVETSDAIFLIGSDVRRDQPLLGHRIRKAWRRGAKVFALNPVDFEFNFDLKDKVVVEPWVMLDRLLELASAASENATPPARKELAEALTGVAVGDAARAMVKALREAADSVLIFGDFAVQHPAASWLRATARYLAQATGSAYNELPEGANGLGLFRAGVLPHRTVGGAAATSPGLTARAMLENPRKTYVLYGCEPHLDFADGAAAMAALAKADKVIAFASYASEALRAIAHVILPIALLPEIDATLVNVDGHAQRLAAGAKAPGETRPGWRVLRALGGLLQQPGFEFSEIADVRADLVRALATARAASGHGGLSARPGKSVGLVRVATTPTYRVDAVVRRAAALHKTALARPPCVSLHPEDALALGAADGAILRIASALGAATLPLSINSRVARSAAWIESAHETTANLPPNGMALSIAKV